MPKLIRSVPAYQKHRASGQAVVSLNGRDFYLGPYGSQVSRAEYDRIIAEWLRQGRQVRPQAEEGCITVVELLAAYLRFAGEYYRKNGVATSEVYAIRSSMRYVKALYGRMPCDEFGPIALQVVMQQMADDGFARTTINQHLSRIKRMFKWGAAQELIPAAISHALACVSGLRKGRTTAKETAPVQPVDDSIVDATLPHLPAVVADMVRLQRLTGMRPGEVCQLRPCDVERSGDVWIYSPTEHKNSDRDKERTVFIGPQAQGILFRYLARDGESYCFRPRDSEEKRRAVAHAARKTRMTCGTKPGDRCKPRPKRAPGNCYTTDSYRRAITRVCDKTGTTRWTPNQLRHAAATQIRQQFGLEAAQIALGHSRADTTQIYARRDRQKGVEVARAIG